MGHTRSEGGSNSLQSSDLLSCLIFCRGGSPAIGLLCDLEGAVQSGALGRGGLPDDVGIEGDGQSLSRHWNLFYT